MCTGGIVTPTRVLMEGWTRRQRGSRGGGSGRDITGGREGDKDVVVFWCVWARLSPPHVF